MFIFFKKYAMSKLHNSKLDTDIAHIEPLQMKRHIAFYMMSWNKWRHSAERAITSGSVLHTKLRLYTKRRSQRVKSTGTCFIQKIYAPSSSLLQGKHLPFSPFPLCLNIFRLFVILSLTQLYRYTLEIFLFSTATFKYTYRAPLRRNGQEYSANVAWLLIGTDSMRSCKLNYHKVR